MSKTREHTGLVVVEAVDHNDHCENATWKCHLPNLAPTVDWLPTKNLKVKLILEVGHPFIKIYDAGKSGSPAK
jgi:hypothetical protein